MKNIAKHKNVIPESFYRESIIKNWPNPSVLKKGIGFFVVLLTCFMFIGNAKVYADYTTGLVGHWTFNSTVADSSGNGYNGTYNPTGNTPIWVSGVSNQALSFNGTSNFVSVICPTTNPSSSCNTNLSMGANTSAGYSVTGWFKASVAKSQVIISKYGSSNYEYALSLTSSNQLVFTTWNSSGGGVGTVDWNSDQAIPNPSAWHFFTIGVSGNQLSISLDNGTIYYATTTGTIGNGAGSIASIAIGQEGAGSASSNFTGSIEDIRIYDQAISSTEIEDIYEAGGGIVAPAISITSPSSESGNISGSINITTSVSDNAAISGVQFTLDGSNLGSLVTLSPYTYSWDSTTVANGTHTLSAIATNSSAMSGTAPGITVNVENPPIISNPLPLGQLPSGTTSTTISVTTNVNATCGYFTSPGTAFSLMNPFSNTGTMSHSTVISGLSNGHSYSYYIKCQDSLLNTSADTSISFSVNSPFTAPSGEGIGDEALQSIPNSALWSPAVNFRPGDGDTVTINPPRFSWSYLPNPSTGNSNYGDIAPKEFIFQVSSNAQFSTTVYNITTLTNTYNFLAPLTAGSTYYWRVGYINPANMSDARTWTTLTTPVNSWGASPTSSSPTCTTTIAPPCWSGVRSFTVASNATTWDRSMLADDSNSGAPLSSYLASHAGHPHMLFNSSTRQGLEDWLNTNADTNVIAAWSGRGGAIATAAGTISQTWWPSQESPTGGSDWSKQIGNAAFVWSMTQDGIVLSSSFNSLGFTSGQENTLLSNLVTNGYINSSNDKITAKFLTLTAYSSMTVNTGISAIDTQAQQIYNILQVYAMGSTPTNLAKALDTLAKYYVAQNGPISDTVSSQFSPMTRTLSLAYDWLYNVMTPTQRQDVLNALNLRADYILNGWGWFYDCVPQTGSPCNGDGGAGDITGTYPGGRNVHAGSSFKQGTSHGIDNFDITMGAAMAGYGDSAPLRQLFDLGMNYMIGVTFPYGTDGSASEGRGYSGGSLFYFDGGNALFNSITAQTAFPEAQFNLNPYWQAASNFWGAWEPVDYRAGHEAWGDTTIGELPDWAEVYVGRDMAYFLNDPVAYEHWVNEDAHIVSENHAESLYLEPYYELPTAFNFPTPSSQDTSSAMLNQFYPQGGWAMGCSQPQNSVDTQTNLGKCFDEGVGYVFEARPKGGNGGHDHYTDLSFQLWAYGTTITDQSGQYNTDYAFSPLAQDTLLVNGIGPVQPNANVINGSYYSRIFGYKSSADYTYFAADGTNAYPSQNLTIQLPDSNNTVFSPVYSGGPLGPVGLKKVQRHFLFVHNKYFVIYDTFASTMPANFSFLYHVLENTLTPNFANGAFSYTSNIYQYFKTQVNSLSVVLTSPGSNYTVGDVLNINQSPGSGATATVTALDPVYSATINNPGTGYKANDVISIVQGSNTTATATVTAVNCSGANCKGPINAVSLSSGGENYTSGPATIAGGSGNADATFNISVLPNSVAQLLVTTSGTGYAFGPATTTGGTGTEAMVNVALPSPSNFPLTPSNVPVYVQQIVAPSEFTVTDQTGIQERANPILSSSSTPENYSMGNESVPRAYALWFTTKTPQTNFHFMTVIYPVKPGDSAPVITSLDDNTAKVVNSDQTVDLISFDPSTVATYDTALTNSSITHKTIVIDLPDMKPTTVSAGGYAQTQTYSFYVASQGSGSGTVSGQNIGCNATCLNTNNTVSQGTTVTLTASPANGSRFSGWSGDCTGLLHCTVTVNSPTAVTANFTTGTTPLYGDVLSSGHVSIYDAELTAEYAIGLTVPGFVSTNAKVDGNTNVDIYDAYLIAEYAIGLITKFSAVQQ